MGIKRGTGNPKENTCKTGEIGKKK